MNLVTLFASLSSDVRQYLLITVNYWAFTLSDGALRMLIVLHFHTLGYSPLEIALLFLFYEFFGVITNLAGGWLGARLGLNRTMHIGLGVQIIALCMLLVPTSLLTVPWVMAAQALSGIAKDLNKMSAKSAIKLLVPDEAQGKLYQWVALLTGSKNTLKGLGFFLGGALLVMAGFQYAVGIMATALVIIWILSMIGLKKGMGKSKNTTKFTQIFSKSSAINILSAARCFLFGARDVWFVVALPVFLSTEFQWSHWKTGSFLALWVIGYGIVQILAPYVTGKHSGNVPSKNAAFTWAAMLATIPACIVVGMSEFPETIWPLMIGLILFGIFFAVNSSLHSYLIVSFSGRDHVSLDIGFYYMANAMGRLIGTVLSGWLFQYYGLISCLISSSAFITLAALLSLLLPSQQEKRS